MQANDFLKQISRALAPEPDDTTGWISIEEFSKKIKRSRSHGGKLLRELFSRGKATRKQFRVFSRNGRIVSVDFYKLKL